MRPAHDPVCQFYMTSRDVERDCRLCRLVSWPAIVIGLGAYFTVKLATGDSIVRLDGRERVIVGMICSAAELSKLRLRGGESPRHVGGAEPPRCSQSRSVGAWRNRPRRDRAQRQRTLRPRPNLLVGAGGMAGLLGGRSCCAAPRRRQPFRPSVTREEQPRWA